MNILVEICTLPFVEKYEHAHRIYDFMMLQKHKTFQGDDKALVWIASRKWVHTYEEALKLYNETTMRNFMYDDECEFVFEKRKKRFNKYVHHVNHKISRNRFSMRFR